MASPSFLLPLLNETLIFHILDRSSNRSSNRDFPVHDLNLSGNRNAPDLDDLDDLDDLAHVAGWEPHVLHDVGHVSLVGPVLHKSCTASHIGRLGPTVDYLSVDDLSELYMSDQ